MYEQTRNLINIMKDKTISPGDDRACQTPVRKAITRYEQRRTLREEPNVYEVEDGNVVAEIEEEIVPGQFFVFEPAEGKKVETLEGIRYVNPSVGEDRQLHNW